MKRVRDALRRGQARWGPFASGEMVVPLYLEARNTADVKANTTAVFRLQVDLPETTRPGVYQGMVRLSSSRGAVEVPLTVTVRDFPLAPVQHVYFGMYARTRDDPVVLKAYWTDMHRHGMTTIGLCGALDVPMAMVDGKVQLTWNGDSAFERSLDEYRVVGFPEPVVWLMGSATLKFAMKPSAKGLMTTATS